MPPHWRPIREKGSFEFREEYLKANAAGAAHDPTQELPRTKGVILGGLLALRESVQLVVTQTDRSVPNWPELALFDCSACHHDLKSPSWRQARNSNPKLLGRPQMSVWP